MGNHPSGQGVVVGNGMVVAYERFHFISMANMVTTILFTF